jgi:hypothetical protein
MVDAPVERNLFERVHHRLDVDSLGTSDGALQAAGTDPDSAAGQQLVFLTELSQTHHLAGQNVHFLGQRATGRAVAALIAGVETLTAQIVNLLYELATNDSSGQPESRTTFHSLWHRVGPPLIVTCWNRNTQCLILSIYLNLFDYSGYVIFGKIQI